MVHTKESILFYLTTIESQVAICILWVLVFVKIVLLRVVNRVSSGHSHVCACAGLIVGGSDHGGV